MLGTGQRNLGIALDCTGLGNQEQRREVKERTRECGVWGEENEQPGTRRKSCRCRMSDPARGSAMGRVALATISALSAPGPPVGSETDPESRGCRSFQGATQLPEAGDGGGGGCHWSAMGVSPAILSLPP